MLCSIETEFREIPFLDTSIFFTTVGV